MNWIRTRRAATVEEAPRRPLPRTLRRAPGAGEQAQQRAASEEPSGSRSDALEVRGLVLDDAVGGLEERLLEPDLRFSRRSSVVVVAHNKHT